MGLQVSRVADVAVQHLDGHWELASGYVLDSEFVLTARHVLTARRAGVPPQNVAHVRLAAAGEEYRPATLYWVGNGEEDFALLRLDTSLPGHPMVQWGNLVRPAEPAPPQPCHIVGFPFSASQPDPRNPAVPIRDTQQFTANILLAGGAMHDLLQVCTDGARDDQALAQLSGAAVFVKGYLVGVVVAQLRGFTGIWAIPVRRLFTAAGNRPPLAGLTMLDVPLDEAYVPPTPAGRSNVETGLGASGLGAGRGVDAAGSVDGLGALTGNLQAATVDLLRELQGLSAYAQGEAHRMMSDEVRVLARAGQDLQAFRRLLDGFCNNSAVWRVLQDEDKARLLCLQARLRLNLDMDVAGAEVLVQRAAEFAQVDDEVRVRALIALHSGGLEGALATLGEPSDCEGMQLRVALLLQAGRTDAAEDLLTRVVAEAPDHHETFRLQALLHLARKRLFEARAAILRALERYHNWEGARYVEAMVNYHGALAPAVLPDRVPTWPEPPAWTMVRSDDESREQLRAARVTFEARAAAASNAEVRLDAQVWQLACFGNDRRMQVEAREHCLRVVDVAPTDPRVVHWAVTRGYTACMRRCAEALQQLLDAGGASPSDATALMNCYLGLRDVSAALKTLRESKRLFAAEGSLSVWRFWRTQCLAHMNPSQRVIEELRRYSDSEQEPYARFAALEALGRATGDWQQQAAHLEATYRAGGDPVFLSEWCSVLGQMRAWAKILEHADVLLGECPTESAVQLVVIAAFNDRQFARCLALLNGHLGVFPERVLPANLVQMRIACMRKLGLVSEAVQVARELVDRESSTANLLTLADACAQTWNLDLLAMVARQLLARDDVEAMDALRLADSLARPNRALARELWHKAYRALPDAAVVPAFAIAERLGIEQPAALMARLFEAGAQHRDDVKRLSLREGVAEIRRLQAELAHFEDGYRQGRAAIHGLGAPSAARLDTLYHLRLSAWAKTPDPLRQAPLLVRYGGRPLMSGLVPTADGANWRLNVDITALVLAAHFGILDRVERGFAPLRIPAYTIPLLTELQKAAEPLQQRRKAFYQQILNLVETGLVRTIDEVPQVDDADSPLCQQLGVPWVERYVLARTNGWYLVEFLPPYRSDRLDEVAELPDGVRQHVVNCRAIANALRSAPYTTAEYEGVLRGLGSEGVAVPSELLPEQQGTLFCHGLILDTLAEAGMLEMVCRRFAVVTERSTVERVRGILAADARSEEAAAWFDALMTKISAGLGSKYVLLPDLSDEAEDGATTGGGLLQAWSLRPLSTLHLEPGDVLWVDDRAVSAVAWQGGMPVVGILDVLGRLVQLHLLDEDAYYSILAEMRAANLRYIPYTTSEILYRLQEATVVDGRLAETTGLEVLRRSAAAALLQRQFIQQPVEPEKSTDPGAEQAFFVDLEQAVQEALIATLVRGDGDAWIARAEWLLENMSIDYLGLWTMKQLPGAASGEQALVGIGLAGILLRACLPLVHAEAPATVDRSAPVPNSPGAERLRMWVVRRLLGPALAGDPLVAVAVADAMKVLLTELYQDEERGGLTSEQRENLWQVVTSLPQPIRRLLEEDGAFTKAIGVLTRPSVQVADLHFAEASFWRTASDAHNGRPATLVTLNGGESIPIERYGGADGAPKVHLWHPRAKQWLDLPEDELPLLPDSVSERVATLAEKSDWFEYADEAVSAVIARLAALEPVEARVAEGRRWREGSASCYYARLEARIAAREQLEPEDLLPPSIEAVLRALRLPSRWSEGLAFEAVLDAAARRMLREVGLNEALLRLASLPVPLPVVLLDAARGLDSEQRRLLRRHLLRNARSAVGVCHLVRLARLWGEDDQLYVTYAARLSLKCLRARWLEEADGFTKFVQWVGERLAWSINAASVPAPALLAAVWSHAHRVLACTYAAGASPTLLASRMWNGLTMLQHDFADWQPEYRSDMAFPRRLPGASVALAGLAYALHVPVSMLVPQTEMAEPGSADAMLQACGLRLFANIRAGNSLGSFLGRSSPASWVGADADGYAAEAERQVGNALVASVGEVRAGNQDGWDRLGLLLSDQPAPEAAGALLEALLSEFVQGELYRTTPRAANEALRLAARQWGAEPELHQRLLVALKASARVLATVAPPVELPASELKAFRAALESAPQVLLTAAIQLSRTLATIDERLDHLLALLTVLVEEWPGFAASIRPFIAHLHEVLSMAENARCWPLLIRLRAEG